MKKSTIIFTIIAVLVELFAGVTFVIGLIGQNPIKIYVATISLIFMPVLLIYYIKNNERD